MGVAINVYSSKILEHQKRSTNFEKKGSEVVYA